MAIPATVRINVPISFPAQVYPGPGLSIAKANGIYTVSLNYAGLGALGAAGISDPGLKGLAILDTVSGVYNFMTLGGFGDALFKLTSTTSLVIGAGSFAFVTQPNKSVGVGSWVIATSNASTANYMVGQVTAYDSVGNLTISVPINGVGGTGTHADWTIRPSSPPAANGVLTNTRLAKTAAYSVVNADKGSTIALGGAASYALTFGAASGYDANFAVLVVNEDTLRSKQIVIPGGAGSFRLYAQQSAIIYNSNNVWRASGANQRWRIPSAVTIFVDPAGNDSNDGLASGTANAFLTVQAALSEGLNNYDLSGIGAALTIQLAIGTYNGSAGVDMVHYSGRNAGAQGGGAITIQGATGVAEDVLLLANGAAVFSINTGAIVFIKNLAVGTTNGGGGGTAISVDSLAKAYVFNVSFHWCDGNHMWASNGSIIEVDSDCQIRGVGGPSGHGGSGGAHVRASAGGVITNNATNLTFGGGTNVDFTWFALASGGQIWYAPTIALGGLTVTGQRYLAQNLGLIATGSGNINLYPGNAAGAAVSPNLYT